MHKKGISRRTVLSHSLGLAAASLASTAVFAKTQRNRGGTVPAGQKPNILFIVADDLGYADLSCYGRRDFETPEIDSLARDGLRFLDGYANSAVCSATRTALITGRYQYRLPLGLEEPLSNSNLGMPPSHPTLPSLLRAQGYGTTLIGKWHLGALPHYGPLQSGYDHFWGFRGGGVDYFTHKYMGQPDLWDGDTPIEATGYMTDLLAERTMESIKGYTAKSQPFFISLHFSAPHWPWEGPDDEEESIRLDASGKPNALFHFDGGSQEIYAQMVTRMDMQIGRILRQMDELGIADNTIIIFTSDNGGERFSDTWPFTGRKTELLEGGLRVPTLVRWPAHVPAGRTSTQMAISMDWMPTLLEAAGALPHPDYMSDGISLMRNMAAPDDVTERTLYWRYKKMDQQACRSGDWKYLKIKNNRFLFNVKDDPMERANLKDRMPEKFAELLGAYSEWNSSMLPLNPQSNSHVFSATELADHFGAE